MPVSTPFQLAYFARKKLAEDNREKLRAFARAKLAAAHKVHPGHVTKQMVVFAAEATFAVPYAEIASRRRDQCVQAPRRAITLIAHDRLCRSFSDIGRFLDRDHSTIMHAYSQAARRLADDPDFAARCAEIESLLWPQETAVGSRQSAVGEAPPPSPVRERGRGEGSPAS
ncbi:MAG: helix-turn-helix domain-containing protein [Rhodomicrobium sp.]